MNELHTLETPRYANLLHSLSMIWGSAQRWNDEHRWQECAHYLMGMGSACNSLVRDNDKREAFDSLYWLASIAQARAHLPPLSTVREVQP